MKGNHSQQCKRFPRKIAIWQVIATVIFTRGIAGMKKRLGALCASLGSSEVPQHSSDWGRAGRASWRGRRYEWPALRPHLWCYGWTPPMSRVEQLVEPWYNKSEADDWCLSFMFIHVYPSSTKHDEDRLIDEGMSWFRLIQAYALVTTCRGENHIKRIIQEPCSNVPYIFIESCVLWKLQGSHYYHSSSNIFHIFRSFAMNSDVGDCRTLTCRMKRIRTKSPKQDKLGQDFHILLVSTAPKIAGSGWKWFNWRTTCLEGYHVKLL